MCRRHVSYIIIKDTRGSLIMYFNYTLFKLYVYANIFFIAQVWFWGRGQLVFWGASKFLGGAVSFQIYWGHCIHKPNVKACIANRKLKVMSFKIESFMVYRK